MRIRLEPKDEYMHELEDAQSFNESMYFNVYDPRVGLGGWFRLGNRANEGYAEMTCCLYLPDKSVGFMYARPHIDNNDAFDAGGMRFEVIEPFKQLRVAFVGKIAILSDPNAMKDPRKAFTEAPHVDASVDLSYRGLSPMMGGEPEFEDHERDNVSESMQFAKGHYEQHVGAKGRIVVGADSWDVDGYGLRDHSWGPRSWQAPYWYRWLTCNAGPEDGFMVSVIASRDGKVRRTGVVFEDGGYTPILDAEISTDWTDEFDQDGLRCIATLPAGRKLEITGKVMSFIPLRNRRDGKVTRIGEGMTEYHWDDKVGYGLSEYLDQIEDGKPVGVDS